MNNSDKENNDSLYTRQTLLAKVKDQYNEKSWDEFIYYYRPFLYNVCRGLNLAHHDAEDVVQQVMLKVWNKLPEFNYDKSQSFRGWMCLIMRNSVRDFYRRKTTRDSKHNKVALDTDESIMMSEIEAKSEEEWQNHIMTLAWNNVSKQFSAKVIEVFSALRDGKTRAEIAEQFTISIDTVSVYKRRVFDALRAEARSLEELLH